ncbi:hypothetical protein AB1Y20_016383 [Prymnesium parvum]|uniref:PDZ domain-containing protein n=1 Tax=Prymnesium parvum TaxID=97485 RepID=A0AB34IG78_PRYPA
MQVDALEREIASVHASVRSRLFAERRRPKRCEEGVKQGTGNADGMKAEKAQLLDIPVRRPVVHEQSGAPCFSRIGVNLIGSHITSIIPGLPAAVAGLKVFDRILSVQGTPLARDGGNAALAKLLQFQRRPLIRVERPPRDALPELASRLTLGFDEEWLAAVEASITGDYPLLVSCLTVLSLRQVAWWERRLDPLEASALALRLQASSTFEPSAPPSNSLLVEIALHHTHAELVQLLLANDICTLRDDGLESPRRPSHSETLDDGASVLSEWSGCNSGAGSSDSGSSSSAHVTGGQRY